MPVYEYRCRMCGTRFEELVRNTNGETIKCPKCHNTEVEKLLSAFAIGSSGGELVSDSEERCTSCPNGDSCPYSGDDYDDF